MAKVVISVVSSGKLSPFTQKTLQSPFEKRNWNSHQHALDSLLTANFEIVGA